MNGLLGIGDFSKMTYLSVKALRHYHAVELLEPASVDPVTGYRFYRPNQVATAHLIRRFRDLGMPLEEVRTLLTVSDVGLRNRTIIAHLERMERQLQDTQDVVASLRVLLEDSQPPLQITRRSEPLTPAFAITAHVDSTEVIGWWVGAFEELHAALRSSGATRTGPDGALFSADFFELGKGEVVAFVPAEGFVSAEGGVPRGRVISYEVPAAELAVATHRGPFSDLDRTYGALGTWIAERSMGVEGPIRERYLPLGDPDDLFDHATEVCWPISA
ncbi:MAG TPA: MerR family transcriptional regulator [Mycobacteriales bacterium]|jgi:DNA-binding transcriptional MerR regulator/effector-binding domain-containing protein|nr:MerR family transcriptional regulator [Mycobacteriales bacterium]